MAMAMAPAATLITSGEVSAAPGDPGEPVVIGVTGDFGWNYPSLLEDHGNMVKGLDPDYVVTTGDNVQTIIPADGTNKYDFTVGRMFCDFLKGAAPGPLCGTGGTSPTNRFFPAPGNHDHIEGDGGGPISNYTSYFDLPGAGTVSGSVPSGSELYYDVVMGPVHVFVLDSDPMLLEEVQGKDATQGEIPGYTTSPTTQQRTWLQSAMAASSAKWKVVALHHSPYSSAPIERGAGYGSSAWVQWPFADWGADVVLSGHHHAYERVVKGEGASQVQYVTNGLGGDYPRPFGDSPIDGSVIRYNNDGNAAMVVSRLTATNTTLSYEAHDGNGNVVDRFDLGEVGGPTAAATATPSSGIAPLLVQLDGSASLNPAGGALTYAWDTDGDGDYDDAAGVNPQVTFSTAASHSVRLKVTDTNGLSSISPVVTVTVNTAQAPAVTTPPAVSGSTVPGQTLTVTNGTWAGTSPITHATQWQRCAPVTAPAYTAAVSADSPLLHWRLGEASGATAADASGNSRTGTYVGTVQRNQTGALRTDTNPAVGFNATDGRVQAAAVTGMPTTAVSAELWVKTADQKNSGLISYAVEGNSDELHITNPDSLIVSLIGTRVPTGVGVNDGQWHHVVATWSNDTGTVALYVDGEQRFTQDGVRVGVALTGGGTMVIGQEQDGVGSGFDSSQALSGQLDEVAVYPAALSATRVAQHYLAAIGLNCTDIAGATASTYTVTSADIGSLLWARVTATNAKRVVTAASATVGPVAIAAIDPAGAFDNPTSPSAGAVKVSGWAADGSAPGTALPVVVYIGGRAGTPGVEQHTLMADKPRATGVPAEYSGDHGFVGTITTAKRGTQEVCVVAGNVGGGVDKELGCQTVSIKGDNPIGARELTTSTRSGELRVKGWALDWSAPTSPTDVYIVIGGVRGAAGTEFHTAKANLRRDDIATAHPGAGPNHGFDRTISTKKHGKQQVCVYTNNLGAGPDTLLSCTTVDIVK